MVTKEGPLVLQSRLHPQVDGTAAYGRMSLRKRITAYDGRASRTKQTGWHDAKTDR
jgi:hypothetical protein